MKKIVITFIVGALIISAINFDISKPISSNNSIAESVKNIDTTIFNEAQKSEISNNFKRFDGYFTENRGQIGNDSVKYYIQGKGVWFLDDEVVFEIKESMESKIRKSWSQESEYPFYPDSKNLENSKPSRSVVLRLNFEGCNKVEPKCIGLLTHRSNFFYGNDSSKWCTNVPNYQEIIYEDLYNNIDLIYYFSDEGLKYDFIINPGAHPNLIKIRIKGHNSLRIINNCLIINTSIGIPIMDSNLSIFYGDCDKGTIEGNFIILNENTYSFWLNKFNPKKKVIIDPLLYSTYIGGSDADKSRDIMVDNQGNAYITGTTESEKFPITNGTFNTSYNWHDLFIFKLNSIGSKLIYSTFIAGSGSEYGRSLKIDNEGYVYVTGFTSSKDFPTTVGAFNTTYSGNSDIFVFKLNPNGSALEYSTFIGGSENDHGEDISIDETGNAYVTGDTKSIDFPTTVGAFNTTYSGKSGKADIFVFKLNYLGSKLLYSTFVGGSSYEIGEGITIDYNDNVYVTGWTKSPDFPTSINAYDTSYNGNQDIFIFKLNSTGSELIYSTFIGANNTDYGSDIVINYNGNAYITGGTNSSNFPITAKAFDKTHNGFYDAFVLKLNSQGSDLIFSTFIGGSESEGGGSITLDSCMNIYIVGGTSSNDFPIITGAFNYSNINIDSFVLKLNSTGKTLLYSTFIGGEQKDSAEEIALDSNKNVYVTGNTKSEDFPTTKDAYDTTYNGGDQWYGDVYVFKLNLSYPPSSPQNLQVESGEGYVKIIWNASSDDGGFNIIEYKIYRRTRSNKEKLLTTIDDKLTYNDTSVKNGQIYYYKISAVNKIGEGSLSEEVNTTPVSRPSPPQNLLVTGGDGYCILSWLAPKNNGGFKVIKYSVYRGLSSGAEIYFKSLNSNITYYIDFSVINGKRYYYYVTALNIIGESYPSNEVNLTPNPDLDSNDMDNDGMPDNWEIKYGFNISDPSDKLIDFDMDNLTNLEEYLNQTDPKDRDSDNDGLTDGKEIKIHHTNPFNPDSDWDGFNDSIELEKGTDPLDEDNYPKDKDDKSEPQNIEKIIYVIIIIVIIAIFLLFIFIFKKNPPKGLKARSNLPETSQRVQLFRPPHQEPPT